MLLDRTSLSAVKVASKDATRTTINGIFVNTDGTTVATDGHALIMVKPCGMSPEDFPVIAGVDPDSKPAATLIHRDTVEKVLKALPKAKNLPILQTALLSPGTEKHTLAVTDLDTPLVFSFRSEGQFPNYAQVLPKGEPEYRIAFNADLLKTLVEVFKTENPTTGSHVVLEFRGSGAISVTPVNGGRCSAIMMPMGHPGSGAVEKTVVEEAA